VQVLGNRAGAPGTTFRIALVGFEPSQEVVLALYRQGGYQAWDNATEFPPVQLDESGQATVGLATELDDPLASFALVPERNGEISEYNLPNESEVFQLTSQ
jgi:hypothetical protein